MTNSINTTTAVAKNARCGQLYYNIQHKTTILQKTIVTIQALWGTTPLAQMYPTPAR